MDLNAKYGKLLQDVYAIDPNKDISKNVASVREIATCKQNLYTRPRMALIGFNDDVGGRHPWEVLNTQRSEVKTPYCKVVVYERPF